MSKRKADSTLVVPDVGRQYGTLISLSTATPGLRALDVLATAQGQARFYWHDEADIAFVGLGRALELFAYGPKRFASIAAQARSLFADAIIPDSDPLATPRLFGGFAFRDDFVPDYTWSDFHPAHFVLPHYQLMQRGDDARLTINIHLPPDEDPAPLIPELRLVLAAKADQLRQTIAAADSVTEPVEAVEATASNAEISFPMSYADWATTIEAAVDEMKNTTLRKVVLSRVCQASFKQPIDTVAALRHLNEAYPGCYRFLFEPRPDHAFFGATPELLASVQGDQLRTMALAGSVAAGETAIQTAENATHLLKSRKDQYEHQLVVDAIYRRLLAVTHELIVPSGPTILKLNNIQHLHTPFSGRLARPDGVLPLVELLHPTPALGGTPRDTAMTFIQNHEPVPRGWYAGPIGWIDSNLDGTFAVAIRSAVSRPKKVWMYAGGGIVSASRPKAEWQESAIKFQPLFNALDLEQPA